MAATHCFASKKTFGVTFGGIHAVGGRNWARSVKATIFILTLIGCMSPCLVAAQTAGGCTACVGAAACDAQHDACVAECRARYFSIDPKRSACFSGCVDVSLECTRAAVNTCRAQNLCR